MPIYEYYCPDNHTVYQFFAKTLEQGRRVPKCPDNPKFRMQKMISSFAVTKGGPDAPPAETGAGTEPSGDARMEEAMQTMEREFGQVDENDPKAMGRMMRRMAELTGEKLDGEMEEVVRKLEEGADPDALEEQLVGRAGEPDADGEGATEAPKAEPREARHRFKVPKKLPPRRDPQLYDYD